MIKKIMFTILFSTIFLQASDQNLTHKESDPSLRDTLNRTIKNRRNLETGELEQWFSEKTQDELDQQEADRLTLSPRTAFIARKLYDETDQNQQTTPIDILSNALLIRIFEKYGISPEMAQKIIQETAQSNRK